MRYLYQGDTRKLPLLEEILAEHTGQTLERLHSDTDRDFVMDAEAALAYGVIDQVINTRGDVADGPIRAA